MLFFILKSPHLRIDFVQHISVNVEIKNNGSFNTIRIAEVCGGRIVKPKINKVINVWILRIINPTDDLPVFCIIKSEFAINIPASSFAAPS